MGVSRRASKINHEDKYFDSSIWGEKQIKKIVHRPKTTVQSLPRDILVDVLGRVASSSFTDAFNAKLSCQDFLEGVEDEYIFQCISLDKFRVIPWLPSDQELSFLTNCFNKGNPEAIFRKGMVEYFSLGKVESGLKYLKMTAEKEHSAATYVYGMIMFSRGDESFRGEAWKLLTSMKYSTSGFSKVRDCRGKLKSVLGQMWIHDSVFVGEANFMCPKRDHAINARRKEFDENKESSSCDSCMWSREFDAFSKIINSFGHRLI